jgi:hypothetical protein
MAKAGRKRLQGKVRTKSGAISRAGQDPRATVLAQHHRMGRLSEWRGTTAGRLLEDDSTHTIGLSRKALYESANRLAQGYANWQAAMASRRPMAVTSGGSNAPEDEERTIRAIRQFEAMNTVLQRAGHAIRQATLDLCCEHHPEDWQPPFAMAYHAVEGLKLLADHFGLDWQSEDRRAA